MHFVRKPDASCDADCRTERDGLPTRGERVCQTTGTVSDFHIVLITELNVDCNLCEKRIRSGPTGSVVNADNLSAVLLQMTLAFDVQWFTERFKSICASITARSFSNYDNMMEGQGVMLK